jgi:predicted MPP superfamily phosphohydrolase
MPASEDPSTPPRRLALSTRLALTVALTISVYAILVHVTVLPAHRADRCQVVTAPLTAIDSLVQLPGRVVSRIVRLTVLHATHHWLSFGWLLAVLANAVFYFVASLLAFRLYARMVGGSRRGDGGVPMESAGVPSPNPQFVTRRRFLAYSTQAVGAGIVAGAGYGIVIEPRNFEIARRRIAIRDLPSSLEGLRLVQLTDLHHGPWLSRDFIRAIVEATNRLEPDLCLLTGDYVHQDPEFMKPAAQELASLRPRIGTLAVLGNHDWWEDVTQMREALADVKIPLIDNDRRILTPDRRLVAAADNGLAFAGLGDLWEDHQDYRAALDDLPDTMPRLLLSHNPDTAEEWRFTRSGLRVDLMLSGHTHGGQIRIPYMGAPVVPSRFGQKYAQGLVQGPTCPVFICRGIGMSGVPIRFGARPEIALLELTRASSSEVKVSLLKQDQPC